MIHELAECDFCGDIFLENEIDIEMSEHDYCVCPNCVDTARKQLIADGEIEEDEFKDDW